MTASAEQAMQELAGVDLLWPVKLDAWLTSAVLSPLIPDADCLSRLPDVVLVREPGMPSPRFRCRSKTE